MAASIVGQVGFSWLIRGANSGFGKLMGREAKNPKDVGATYERWKKLNQRKTAAATEAIESAAISESSLNNAIDSNLDLAVAKNIPLNEAGDTIAKQVDDLINQQLNKAAKDAEQGTFFDEDGNSITQKAPEAGKAPDAAKGPVSGEQQTLFNEGILSADERKILENVLELQRRAADNPVDIDSAGECHYRDS